MPLANGWSHQAGERQAGDDVYGHINALTATGTFGAPPHS
jgi:hypothetical protein